MTVNGGGQRRDPGAMEQVIRCNEEAWSKQRFAAIFLTECVDIAILIHAMSVICTMLDVISIILDTNFIKDALCC